MTQTLIRESEQKLIDLNFDVSVFDGGVDELDDLQMSWSKGLWCRPTNFYCPSYGCY